MHDAERSREAARAGCEATAMTDADTNPALTPGSRLGRYRIDGVLGAGGMGTVFLAHDTTLERPVAIKVVSDIADAAARERLLKEARSASALNHPNICTIYEVGHEEGLAFIAMEHVDGRSLAAHLDHGPLSTRDALRHGTDVAAALAHAHARGLVHRDLKAANVILTAEGRPKLVDFGLASRLVQHGSDATLAVTAATGGTVLGTPYAMAPEQVRGERADERSDIWALGVLLFEMLSASRPFSNPNIADLFTAILRDPPAKLMQPGIPAALRSVIDRCLTKDPGRRYQSAEDVRGALDEIAAGLSSSRSKTAAANAQAGMTPLAAPPILERAGGDFVFVGRQKERMQLDEAWARAAEGRRQLVLLGGEAGIGKTRLSLEFARTCAAAQATVLIGRCDEEALIPYQPFVEALGWFARACPEPDLQAALDAAGGGGELGAFVPDFLVRLPSLPPPTQMSAQGQRYRLFETVSAFLAAASKPFPVLLVVDDLHWADKPTLSLLRHIIRGADSARLCILGTYRESELPAPHPLTELLAELRRERDVLRVSLSGLETTQVQALVETVTTPDVSSQLAGRMTDSTGGNPFFVGELLRHLRETGALKDLAALHEQRADSTLGLPEGVREVIARRVSRLSETCQKAMTLASVLGREFDVDVLQAFSEIPEEPLLDAVDEACAAQCVDEVRGKAGRYSFHHALIRDALYDDLPASRRLRHHRRAGEVLERLSVGASDHVTDLAYHFCLAAPTGTSEKAVDYATRAGDQMAAALAHEEATRYYDMALAVLDAMPPGPDHERKRVVVLRSRSRAFGNLGQWGQQRATLHDVLTRLDADRLEERSEVLSELSQACFWLFDIPSLESASTEALNLAEKVGRPDIAANALGWLARCRQAGGELLEAIETDRVTIERYGAAAQVSFSIGSAALYWAGRGHEAVAVAERAVKIAETSHDATSTMNSLSHHAISLAAVGRYKDAIAAFARTQEFGRKYGVLPLLARAISMSAGFRLALGDLDGAEAIAHEARELAQRVNFPPTIVSPGIDLLLIGARRGDPGTVERLFEETVAASQKTPGWHGWLWNLRLCQVRAELALARGDGDAARLEATEAIAQSRKCGRRKYESLALLTRADALHGLGRTQEALVDARLAVSVARTTEDPALTLQALDTLLGIDGDDQLAAEARALSSHIFENLPDDDELRRCVERWAVVQRVQRL